MTAFQNYHSILEEIQQLSPEAVLLPVTKNQSAETLQQLLQHHIPALAENRVQEAEEKFAQLEEFTFKKHLIGHLQTNKAKKATQLFDVVQSVDSLKIAQHLSKHATSLNKTLEIYLQINTAHDPAKHGFTPDEALHIAPEIIQLPSLHLNGLMTIGALTENKAKTKESFLALKKIFKEFQEKDFFHTPHPQLSMGMTNDYKIALDCGSTMIRVGRKIFE